MLFIFALLFSSAAWSSPQFALIPAGSFFMGSPESEEDRYPDEGPAHALAVPSFEMQTTEVTQAQWLEVMGANPSYFKEKKFCPETFALVSRLPLCPDLPVENVSWWAVQDFLEKLNQNSDYLYRLPTEAEWERAARGGTETAYSFGDSVGDLREYAWFDGNSEQTRAVASKRANPYGLFDMHGNVHEWTSTSFAYYPGSTLPVPSTPPRWSIRGGSFFSMARNLRSAFRMGRSAKEYNETIGFRLVREARP